MTYVAINLDTGSRAYGVPVESGLPVDILVSMTTVLMPELDPIDWYWADRGRLRFTFFRREADAEAFAGMIQGRNRARLGRMSHISNTRCD